MNRSIPPRYHLVVQHQLSVEQAVSIEIYAEKREDADNDIQHFVGLMTVAHEEARARAFAQAEKLRDLTMQKIGNLQAEEQRLTAVVERLRAEAAPADQQANGAADG